MSQNAEEVKTPLQEILERHGVYSKTLESDLSALYAKDASCPPYLDMVNFTEGIVYAPDEEHCLTVCGVTDEIKNKFNTFAMKKDITILEEIKNMAFRECVLAMKGITFERDVNEYKRGDDVPVLYHMTNMKEVNKLLSCIPSKIKSMVYEAASYLGEVQSDESKNWKKQ